MTRRAALAHDRLTVALLNLVHTGERPHCSDPSTHEWWTSEHKAARRLA
jgi:hypothetical protein